MAANKAKTTPATTWSYGSGADGQVHENPEWKKAKQALASINKTHAPAYIPQASLTQAEAGKFHSTVGNVAAVQQQQLYPWYQQTQQHYVGYTYPYNHYNPTGLCSDAYTPGQYGIHPGPYIGRYDCNRQRLPVPGMEEQASSYSSQLQPSPPATLQPPQSPTVLVIPPPSPSPSIPPPPNSQSPSPPSQNACSAGNTVPQPYPSDDSTQMQGCNHSQGMHNHDQSFLTQNSYQRTPNESQQPNPSQFTTGLGKGEANENKNQMLGQLLWHRMKQSLRTPAVKVNIKKRPDQVQRSSVSKQAFAPGKKPSGLNPTPTFPSAASAAPGGALPRPEDWPQAMKEYVYWCFSACETEEEKDRTKTVLKEILEDRLKDGSAYTIDWTSKPLPKLQVQRSRWEPVQPQHSSDGSINHGGSTAAAASAGRGGDHRLDPNRNTFSQRNPSLSSTQSSCCSPSSSHHHHGDRSSKRPRLMDSRSLSDSSISSDLQAPLSRPSQKGGHSHGRDRDRECRDGERRQRRGDIDMDDENPTSRKKRKSGDSGLDFHNPNKDAKKRR